MKIVKYIFAILVIISLITFVDLQQLISVFKGLSWPLMAYLMFISIALVYASALKWQFFLEVLGTRISAFKLFNYYIMGYFVNLLMPSFLGGDLARSWYVGKSSGQHEALAATLLERYTGFVAMLMLGLVFSFTVSVVTFEIKVVIVLLVLGTIVGSVVALSPLSLKLFKRWELIYKHLNKVQEALNFAKGHREAFIKSMLLAFLFHCLTVINTMTAAYAIGWTSVSGSDLFVVLPIILLIGALPITPAGLGIQEGAFYYFLQQIGATPEQAIAVALILRAKSYVLALWGAMIWLKSDRKHSNVAGDVVVTEL